MKKIYYFIDKIKSYTFFPLRNFYYSKRFKNCGPKLRIHGKLILKSPEKITIGNNCAINDFALLNGRGGITIGDDVVISSFAKIISTGLDVVGGYENSGLIKEHVHKGVHIGKGTWIGTGAIILPGVEIEGSGVVIAAGSVVTKSIKENNVIVAGVPGKIIKKTR